MEPNPRPKNPPLNRSHTAEPDLSPPKAARQTQSSRLSSFHPHAHHHLYLHRHGSHHHHGSDKSAVPQSAIVPGSNVATAEWSTHPSALQLPASSSVVGSPMESRTQSRRQSVSLIDERDGAKSQRQSLDKMRKKPKADLNVELIKETEKHKGRVKEIRKTLVSLSTAATVATRQLDMTYYSVLEKATILQSTIIALQELSKRTSTLHHDFQEDADDLIKDIGSQIDRFRDTEESQPQIDALEQRIKNGRTKVSALSDRLEQVRKNVEHWETQEAQWQAKTSRRLRILWGTVMSVFLLFLILWIVHRFQAPLPTKTKVFATRPNSSDDNAAPFNTASPGVGFIGPDKQSPSPEVHPGLRLSFLFGQDINDDDGSMLKVFDEL